MAEELVVEREILLDGDVADVWPLIATAEGWQQWLVDAAAVDVSADADGEVTDDGVTRDVRVTDVDEHRSVSFRWWEHDDPSAGSEVIIEVQPLLSGGCRVRIVERLTGMSMSARCNAMWDVRALLLALTQCTLARV